MIRRKNQLQNLLKTQLFCYTGVFFLTTLGLSAHIQAEQSIQSDTLAFNTTQLPSEPTPERFVDQVNRLANELLKEKAQQLKENNQGQLKFSLKGVHAKLPFKACTTQPTLQFIHDDWLKSKSHLKAVCKDENKSLLIGVEMSLEKPVYIALQAIDRLEPLGQKVQLQNRNILSLNQGYIDSAQQLEGMVSKRNLRPGTPLNPRLLEKEVLVARNSLVSIEARFSGIAVSAQGTALDKGAKGDIIRIRNNRSNRIINARVITKNHVEVQL